MSELKMSPIPTRYVLADAYLAGARTVADLPVVAPTTWGVFSCAAELLSDAVRVLRHVLDEVIVDRSEGMRMVRMEFDSDLMINGVNMEFVTTLSLDRLLRILRTVDEDTHVMRETLRPVPLAANSLERDGSVTYREMLADREPGYLRAIEAFITRCVQQGLVPPDTRDETLFAALFADHPPAQQRALSRAQREYIAIGRQHDRAGPG